MKLRERLLRSFAEAHPTESAAILSEQSADDAAEVLALLPEEAAAGVLERAASSLAAGAVSRMDVAQATALLARLPPERAAALLRQLEPATRETLLDTLPHPEQVRSLLTYPRGTAGALMDPSVPALPTELDLEDARRQLGALAGHLALEVYLVGPEHRLSAVAELRDILDSARRGTLAALGRPVEPLREAADLASLSAHPGWLRQGTVPVVDERGTYLGAVRAESVRQLAHEAATRRSRGGADAVAALGELFWLGLTGFLSSVAQPQAEEDR